MGKLKALKDALDMSKAARMKRAAEQGFDTSRVMYHGTGADFPAFDPLKVGRGTDKGWFGKGYYFSPDQKVANQYAAGESPNVIPAALKVSNPYDWRKNEGMGMRSMTDGEIWIKTQALKSAGYDAVDVYEEVVKLGPNERLSDDLWTEIVRGQLKKGEIVPSREMVEDGMRMGMSSKEEWARSLGRDIADRLPMERTLKERMVFDPEQIRSINAAFDPANIGKNDLLGAVDPRLLAPLAVGATGAVAAQRYGDSEEVARVYQDFVNRRKQKQEIWRKIRQGGEALRAIGQGMAAGIASDAYRLGGYLSPQPVQDTEAQAETLQNKLAYMPQDQNPIIDEMGRQIDQFGRDVRPLVNAFQQTPIYKAYEMLPERAQGVVNVLSNYAF